MSYTPGPWKQMELPNGDGGLFILGPDGKGVANTWSDSRPECEDNARLIAAAPDLLEACQEFVRKCECGEAKSTRSYAQMKSAIAKATEEVRL